MNVREGFRTLALVGLGGLMGGTMVVAWGARRESGAALAVCYVAAVNKIKGAAAGFALRPLALC